VKVILAAVAQEGVTGQRLAHPLKHAVAESRLQVRVRGDARIVKLHNLLVKDGSKTLSNMVCPPSEVGVTLTAAAHDPPGASELGQPLTSAGRNPIDSEPDVVFVMPKVNGAEAALTRRAPKSRREVVMVKVGDWPSPLSATAGCGYGALSLKDSVAVNRYGNGGVIVTPTAQAPPAGTVRPEQESLASPKAPGLAPEKVTPLTVSGCVVGFLRVTT
jgi:hypothetical protein